MIISDINPERIKRELIKQDKNWIIKRASVNSLEGRSLLNEGLMGLLANKLSKPVPRYILNFDSNELVLAVEKKGNVNKKYFERYIRELARVIAQFHKPFKGYDNKISYLIHGDLHPTNIVWDNNKKPWLIDLEFGKITNSKDDIQGDLERLLQFFSSIKQKEAFLQYYQKYFK